MPENVPNKMLPCTTLYQVLHWHNLDIKNQTVNSFKTRKTVGKEMLSPAYALVILLSNLDCFTACFIVTVGV